MIWAIVIVAVAVATAGGALAAVLASRAKRDYDARLEIVPGVPTNAPPEWAGSHSFEAKLHRRLGDAARSLRHQSFTSSSFLAQRVALEEEALKIDARLVAVAALTGPQRQQRLDDVARLVTRYEEAVGELVVATLDEPGAVEHAISESEIKLRALEAARIEVERADGSGSTR
jgi:hypothetical protein